jgi:hypothetical protein
MNPDLLDEYMVKEKLKNGECVMVMNTKDSSSTWSDLRLIADAKDLNKPLIGWAVCRFCCAAFRTHSKLDGTVSHIQEIGDAGDATRDRGDTALLLIR